MLSNNARTVLLPLDLGSVENYDSTVFPLTRFEANGSIHTGQLFLQATLQEMLKIHELSENLNSESNQELLQQAKDAYNTLMEQKVALEQEQKSINPFKLYAAHREKRLFVEAGRKLYTSTKMASERMSRELLATGMSSVNVPPAEVDSIAPHEQIAGFSVVITEETAAFLNETLESSGSPFYNINLANGHNSNSNITEATMNSGGSNNSGVVIQDPNPSLESPSS
ncbi:hypothetical protein BU15DRAFT_80964 [Melanogaster broomeanus]|nr:hypothetical protein BU15DRAFT_80964 [Melanogaster broomeanus]